jgi:hypothetical protein
MMTMDFSQESRPRIDVVCKSMVVQHLIVMATIVTASATAARVGDMVLAAN